MNSKRMALLFAVILLVAGAGFMFARFRNPKIDPRLIGRVQRQDLIQRLTVAGNVVAKRSSFVQPTYSSYVGKLYVKLGDKVKAGQPLVSLSQNPTDVAGSFPMRAPFSGTVVQVLAEQGDYVEASSSTDKALLRVDDLSQMYVDADVPELEYPKISLGQEVIVKASPILDHTYKGKVIEKFLASKKAERWERGRVEYPVRILLTEIDDQLKPGMSAIVDIVAFRKDKVLSLRQEFVQSQGDKYFVILKSGEHRDIQVGAQNDEAFEIKSGLKEGDEVRQVDFLAIETSGG